MKKIQELIGIGVVGALVGAFLGLLLYLFEPIGGSSFTDTVLVLRWSPKTGQVVKMGFCS